MRKKDKNNKKKIKKFNKILQFFVVSIIPILSIWYIKKDDMRNERILEPKFSLEKHANEDGSSIWKIYNSGESINNAIIYPTRYVTFGISNDELDINTEITIEILGYFSEDNYYNNSDKTFYVKDEKQLQLNNFIEKCLNSFDSEDGWIRDYLCSFDIGDNWIVDYSDSIYFTINYRDYKNKKHNIIFTTSDGSFFEDNSERKIFGDEFLQLDTVTQIPEPDIIAPSKFENTCVVTINYKNATTQEIIENEVDYEEYLYLAIVDLIFSKDKSVEEMLGELKLTYD